MIQRKPVLYDTLEEWLKHKDWRLKRRYLWWRRTHDEFLVNIRQWKLKDILWWGRSHNNFSVKCFQLHFNDICWWRRDHNDINSNQFHDIKNKFYIIKEMHFRDSEKYTKVIDIWRWRRRRHNDFNSNQFHLLRLPTAALLWVWLNLFSYLTNWQHSISPIYEDSGVGLSGDIGAYALFLQ